MFTRLQTKLFAAFFLLLLMSSVTTFIAVSQLDTENLRLWLFGMLGVSWLLGIGFAFSISNTLKQRINAVTEQTNSVLQGNLKSLDQEINGDDDDEFAVITQKNFKISQILFALLQDLEIIAQASRDGKLQQRLEMDKYQGDWKQIALTVNTLLDAATRPIDAQAAVLQKMAEGVLNTHITDNFKGEHNRIKDAVNRIADIAANVMHEFDSLLSDFEAGDFARRASTEGYDGDWNTILVGVNRILGIVHQSTQEVQTQNWIKTGLAELSGRIRGDMSLNDLAYQVASYIAVYTNAQIGALYLWNESDERLHLTGSYAYEFRKSLSQSFALGESLVGQAALEKQIIVVSDLPDDYVRITSGIGGVTARSTIVVPILHEGNIKGVLELGSLTEFSKETLDLLRLYSDTIGMAVVVAESAVTTKFLLKQAQEQAEKLKSQQEELQQYNEELEEQTQALQENELALKIQQEELQQSNEELEEQTQALQASEAQLIKQQEELEQSNQALEEQTQALQASEAQLKLQQEELQQTNEELIERTEALEQQRDKVEQKNNLLKAAQDDLTRRAEELAITSKYKSEFLANMSHELRTPLNSMLLLSRSLSDNREGNLNEKQVQSARVVYQSGNDLLSIINDILDLSKIESGHELAVMETVPLDEVISQTEGLYRPVAADKGLEFVVDVAENTPKDLYTDRQRLGQILRNLLSNAFKFTERGSVSLSLWIPDSFTDKYANMLAISVADTGVGIPEDKQLAIWEAFQQADGSISRQYGGTGLGLTISRELTRLLGGEIQVESELNVGSRFTLYLPLNGINISTNEISAEKLPIPVISEAFEQIKTKAVKNRPVVRISDDRETLVSDDCVILIVEDDSIFAEVLASLCHKNGYQYLAAASAEEALNLLASYNIIGIFLDMLLPEKDGLFLLTHIKENLDKAHIPIYVMSADSSYSDVISHGALGFLTKPVTEEELEKAFESINDIIVDKVKKILVIEDDPKLATSITVLLGEDKTSIVTAENGKLALATIEANYFDLIVLDFGLPDMTGLELLKRANENRSVKMPPVIIYTGRDLTRQEYEEIQKYTNSVIVKSVQSDERLLAESRLFLHRAVASLPEKSKKMLLSLHDKDAMFQGKKVLLVDDDIRNIFSLSAVLEERGMFVMTASNGQEALEQLKSVRVNNVDLIITDIMMPGMDGLELIKLIRAEDCYYSLPIIALTAKAMKEDRHRCLEAGASDYLTKPVDVDRLLSMLHVWLYR